MLRQLNIVDVQAESDLNGNDMDFLSASKARELSVLSDIDSGRLTLVAGILILIFLTDT
jgi:hypothetical protein